MNRREMMQAAAAAVARAALPKVAEPQPMMIVGDPIPNALDFSDCCSCGCFCCEPKPKWVNYTFSYAAAEVATPVDPDEVLENVQSLRFAPDGRLYIDGSRA